MSLEQTEADLKIARSQLRQRDARTVDALVHEQWLSTVIKQRCLPRKCARPQHLSKSEQALLLQPSTKKVPAQWRRISISTIAKTTEPQRVPVVDPLWDVIRPSQGFSQTMQCVSAQNYRDMWQQACHKYGTSTHRQERLTLTAQEFNEQTRGLLEQLYCCPVVSTDRDRDSDQEREPADAAVPRCSNLQVVLGVFESPTAFYLIQPYLEHTVADCVVFSPAMFANSYAKQLFVLYQILHAVLSCHDLGVLCGELSLQDLALDGKLWVRLPVPDCRKRVAKAGNVVKNNQVTTTKDLTWEESELRSLTHKWVHRRMSNFDYLMVLNRFAGRRMCDPNHHPVLPWIMDFTQPQGGWRDLTRSKFRLNKGDHQLDLMYESDNVVPSVSHDVGSHAHVPHHITDMLSDITYYVYKARRMPKTVLCTNVRSNWVPEEYPMSMQRIYEWSPDECIPEFFSDPTIFQSLHTDLPDLEVPSWCSSPQDFVEKHRAALESEFISLRIHHWIDLTFGYKLSGKDAVKAKNVCFYLVDNHTRPVNHGMVQLFHTPHPLRKCGANSFTWEPPPVLQLGRANGRSTEVEQAKMVLEEDSDSLTESGRLDVVEPDVFYPDTDSMVTQGDGFYGNQETDTQTDGYAALKSALQVFGETYDRPVSAATDESGSLEKDKKSGRGRPFFSRTRTETERTKSETRPEEASIRLPEGFNPLAALVQVESELKFMATGAQHVQHNQVSSSDQSVSGEEEEESTISTHLLTQDITAVGCLVAELMLGSKLGVLSPQANLQERVNNIRKHVLELPRPIQEAVETILQLDWKENPSSGRSDTCTGDGITGLPTSTLGSLLNPHTSPFPFPPYFPKLHEYLSQHVQQERSARQVHLVTKWLPDLLPELNQEGLELLLPYVVSLLESPKSGAEATICIFDIFAQYLGPTMTSRKLLRPLTNLMDHGNVSLSYVKLFHRTFLLQLLVRFGLQTFLGQIVGLIVEATADLRDPLAELTAIGRLSPPEEDVDLGMDALQPSYEEDEQEDPLMYDNITTETGMSFPNVTSRSCTDGTDNNFSLERYRQNVERVISEGDSQSLNEEGSTFSGDILLDGTSSDIDRDDEETEYSTSERISLVDCGTDEDSLQDFARSASLGPDQNLDMTELESSSLRRVEAGTSKENFSVGSPGGVSVHSVSRLVVNDGQGSDEEEEEQRSSDTEEVGDQQEDTGRSQVDSRGAVYSLVTSGESGKQEVDLNLSILEEFEEGLTVADVAADSIMWLADRLGPALTGRYLGKNLLKLLNNCYQGPEQQCLVEGEGEQATVSSRTVVGDRHSRLVLKCLTDIVVMYGESVITSQYIPHITFMVSSGRSRLNSKMEAGLIGAMVLLRHVVPFMSDTTIMDNLKMLERDILKPLISLVSNPCVTFPGSGQARAVVCYKLVDAMVLVTLRIGREMAREELNKLLRQFFNCFDLVHGEGNTTEENPTTSKASSFSLSDSMEFVEIKMDTNTNTYRIGTPIRINSISPLSSDPRRSSRVKLNASPVMPNGLYDGEVTSSQKEAGMEDLRVVFTPALAHAAFIPLCRLTGSIHMERILKNHDLIWKLSSTYETALSTHNLGAQPGADVLSDNDDETPSSENRTAWFVDMGAKVSSQEKSEDTQEFGYNVQMVGNRIELRSDPAPEPTASVAPKPAIQTRLQKHFAEGPPVMDETVCPSRVDLPRSERHLKGNWQAYWDYEIGLGERDNVFHFNQIKLQTFHGHSNSVRSLYIMDMENAFISASKDKTVKLWSIRNHGDGYSRSGCRWTYTQHRKSVFHVGMVEPLRLAVSCDTNVHLWDPFVGAMVRVFDCSRNPISVLSCLPPPHTTMIAATAEATLRFIDGRTANFQHEFRVTGGQSMGLIRCLCVSPSGTWVAVGFSSGVVSALDVRTGTIIKMWRAHEGEILQMKAYDNNSFISSSVDHNIVLWRGFDGKPACLFKGHSEPAHALCLYNNQVISATASNKIGIHSALNSKASFTLTKLRSEAFKGVMTAAAVLPLNRLLLLASDSGSIRLLA